MSAKRTINVSLEKGTKMMVEHVDRDGTRHTFKFGRKPDGSYVGDNCFLDMYEFEEDGNKPIIKLRLKNKNEKNGAWFAAGWPPKEKSAVYRSEEFSEPPQDDFPEGW